MLFGKEYNAQRFAMALRVTCMEADVRTMASGVDTMIGACVAAHWPLLSVTHVASRLAPWVQGIAG